MSRIRWQPLDDVPIDFGQCGAGPYSHTWTLIIEEGQLSLTSGCVYCDGAVFDTPEIIFSDGRVLGRMECIPDHPDLGGWHGTEPCDCGWTWRFTPEYIEPEDTEASE